MATSKIQDERIQHLNEAEVGDGDYVLYWMQSSRRLTHNHALDYALRCAGEHGRPLVVYEGLRLDYPWASRRLHRFVLEGMRDNAREAKRLGLHYWPFVETPEAPDSMTVTGMGGSGDSRSAPAWS